MGRHPLQYQSGVGAVSAVLLVVTCAVIIAGMAVVLWRKRIAGGPPVMGMLETKPEAT